MDSVKYSTNLVKSNQGSAYHGKMEEQYMHQTMQTVIFRPTYFLLYILISEKCHILSNALNESLDQSFKSNFFYFY